MENGCFIFSRYAILTGHETGYGPGFEKETKTAGERQKKGNVERREGDGKRERKQKTKGRGEYKGGNGRGGKLLFKKAIVRGSKRG